MQHSILSIFLILFAASANAENLRAAPGVPVTLSSGISVVFEQSGVVRFPNTEDRAAILMFRAKPDVLGNDSGMDYIETQERLHEYAVNICDEYGEEHVARIRKAQPTQKLAHVAVQLKFYTRNVGQPDKFVAWTTIFHIDGNNCGERLTK